ncbi:unnamed protein product, partial [Musa textilis]
QSQFPKELGRWYRQRTQLHSSRVQLKGLEASMVSCTIAGSPPRHTNPSPLTCRHDHPIGQPIANHESKRLKWPIKKSNQRQDTAVHDENSKRDNFGYS